MAITSEPGLPAMIDSSAGPGDAAAFPLGGAEGTALGEMAVAVLDDPTTVPAAGTARRHPVAILAAAFAVGLAISLSVAAVGLLAYDAAFDHRIIPGVQAGSVDLSGLDRASATAALMKAYGGLGQGQVVIGAVGGPVTIPYAEFSRRADVGAMVDEAMAVGRVGDPFSRAVAEIRAVLRRTEVAPQVTIDAASLAAEIDRELVLRQRSPVDATISMTPKGIATSPAEPGRTFDIAAVTATVSEAVLQPDAPAVVVVDAPATAVEPGVSDADIVQARTATARMIADVTVADGKKRWTIKAATVRGWVDFGAPADGVARRTGEGASTTPVIEPQAVARSLASVAKAIDRKAVSATFLTSKSGKVVGVSASADGRVLDRAATATAIASALANRALGAPVAPVPAVVRTTQPKLTTEDAQKVAPLMVRLSVWTTYFPISDHNFYGANIWLPAQFINGTVLAPGQTFDWWTVVGPVTPARGFGAGGVIAGDHTDPTGALGGGMCSSSTTLFNAALRAGLQMGARGNHIYYINRYPLGLDATVWIEGRARQSMSFTNDLPTPILIKGIKIVGSGGRGYVRYEIWGIPDGRKVSIGSPVVRNLVYATTDTVYVSSLPHGVRQQTEYPSNGMDVSVTRVVRDKAGRVIHNETYSSHYRLWNGRIEVGL
jgi:vancomycin resistance protein YoaR